MILKAVKCSETEGPLKYLFIRTHAIEGLQFPHVQKIGFILISISSSDVLHEIILCIELGQCSSTVFAIVNALSVDTKLYNPVREKCVIDLVAASGTSLYTQ